MLVKSILPVAVEDNHTYLVENLKPKTQYTFELSLYYPSSEDPYIWPSDGRFTYETLGKITFIIIGDSLLTIKTELDLYLFCNLLDYLT